MYIHIHADFACKMRPLRGNGTFTGGSLQEAKRRYSQAAGSWMRKRRYPLTVKDPFYQSTRQKTSTPPASFPCAARVSMHLILLIFSTCLYNRFFLNNPQHTHTFLKEEADPVTDKFLSPRVKFLKLLPILLQKGYCINQHRSVPEDFFMSFHQ